METCDIKKLKVLWKLEWLYKQVPFCVEREPKKNFAVSHVRSINTEKMEENINNCTASLSPEKREKEGLPYFKGQKSVWYWPVQIW